MPAADAGAALTNPAATELMTMAPMGSRNVAIRRLASLRCTLSSPSFLRFVTGDIGQKCPEPKRSFDERRTNPAGPGLGDRLCADRTRLVCNRFGRPLPPMSCLRRGRRTPCATEGRRVRNETPTTGPTAASAARRGAGSPWRRLRRPAGTAHAVALCDFSAPRPASEAACSDDHGTMPSGGLSWTGRGTPGGSAGGAPHPRGRPSTRSATMFRWISDAPPEMVPANERRNCRAQAPS